MLLFESCIAIYSNKKIYNIKEIVIGGGGGGGGGGRVNTICPTCAVD